jgi:hypothetical protein
MSKLHGLERLGDLSCPRHEVRLKAGALNEVIPLARRGTIARIRPAHRAGWRLFVATFALIAFAAQSYLTQTHIHLAQPLSTAEAALSIAPDTKFGKQAEAQQGAPNNKLPADEDPLKCPLCQAVGYSGHFVTPSAVALLLPNAAISILPVAPAIVLLFEARSHIWQGRGPPRS